MNIPYDKLGITDALIPFVSPDAPRASRLALARGQLPAETEALLGALYALSCDPDQEISEAAVATIRVVPNAHTAIHQRTHPKVLELLAQVRPDPTLDEAIIHVRNANDRTALLIAARAPKVLAEQIAENHERMLITPDVVVALHGNMNTPAEALERAISFLRMQRCLPELPPTRGAALPPPKQDAAFDLDAEIEAALSGKASPLLENRKRLEVFDLDALKNAGGSTKGFAFDFKIDDEFSLDMLDDGAAAEAAPEHRQSVSQRIANMSPGQKIKLAYLGNKESRGILIRDRNKQVAVAVVKSGRLTDAEVVAHAGNRNLPDDVLREMAANREWMRKYPIKVALVNNPRCPPSVAVGIVNVLQVKDLEALGRNRNVSSVVFTLAGKMAQQKKQGGKADD